MSYRAVLFLSVLFSTTLNAQWTQQATGFVATGRGINTISIVDSNIVWASAYDANNTANYITEFTRTTNSGQTWMPGTINTGVIGAGIANISAINDTVAWSCIYHPAQTAAGGIWKTTNGGTSWSQQSTATFTAASFPDFVYFWNANNGIAVGDPKGGYFEIYTTSDGGNTWARHADSTMLSTVSNAEYAYTNGFSVIGNTLWFGTSQGRVFKTTDMGLTFSNSTVGNGVAKTQTVTFSTADTGYACMQNSDEKTWVIAKSIDGGASWNPLQNNSSVSNYNIFNADVFAVPNTSVLVSVGSRNGGKGSSYSPDGGQTWTHLEDTAIAPVRLCVRFLNQTTGWAGGVNSDQFNGGIYKYTGGYVGVKENSLKDADILAYPNPANEFLFIRIKASDTKINSLRLLSIEGREVLSLPAPNQNSVSLDISSVPAGFYLAELQTGSGLAIKKIIIE